MPPMVMVGNFRNVIPDVNPPYSASMVKLNASFVSDSRGSFAINTVGGTATTSTAVSGYPNCRDSGVFPPAKGSYVGKNFRGFEFSGTSLVVGRKNFTLEFYYKMIAPTSNFNWGIDLNSQFRVLYDGSLWGTAVDGPLASGFSPTVNVWHHVAVCRLGHTLSIYVDGILRATRTTSSIANITSTIAHVGGTYDTATIGMIDRARITIDHAMYTENFTPPDASYFV